MNRKSLIKLTGLLLTALVLAACGGGEGTSDGGMQDGNQPIDYSVSSHWLSLPITPAPQFPVDLFYVYPTSWSTTNTQTVTICDIDNPSMLQGASGAFLRQATAFQSFANIYAPFYRQASMVVLAVPPTEHSAIIGGIPTGDVSAAFDYYMKHYNNGRPFFLMGHSQGADVLTYFLSGYMSQHPDYLKKMIAAYVIGTPVTSGYLSANPHLKYATGPDDTGVIISWNTEAPGVAPGTNPVLMNQIGIVINPISWTLDETDAPASQGLGSFLPTPFPSGSTWALSPQYADAQINKALGVLICNTCDEEAIHLAYTSMPLGVYHGLDIPFYYANISQNAQNRAAKFMSK